MAEISLIMPVYNAERYMNRAIKCVLSQTFYDYELILINDGSQDKTLSIMNKYAADRRIKIIDKPHEGAAAARNDGLEIATGTYVCFIDGYDEMKMDLLEKTVAHAKTNQADLLMFGHYKEQVNVLGKVTASIPIKMKAGNYSRENLPEWSIDAESLAMIGYVWNKLFRRKVLIENNIRFNPTMTHFEDIDFNASVLKVIERFTILDECLYHYKQRGRVSFIPTYPPNQFDELLSAVGNREEILKSWGNDPSLAEAAASYLHVYAIKGYCIDLFSNKNDLRFIEKCDYLNQAINRPLTRERVKEFRAGNTTEWIFKLSIRSRLGVVLALISTVYTLPHKILQEKTS